MWFYSKKIIDEWGLLPMNFTCHQCRGKKCEEVSYIKWTTTSRAEPINQLSYNANNFKVKTWATTGNNSALKELSRLNDSNNRINRMKKNRLSVYCTLYGLIYLSSDSPLIYDLLKQTSLNYSYNSREVTTNFNIAFFNTYSNCFSYILWSDYA